MSELAAANGVFVGCYVRVLSLPSDGVRYGAHEEAIRKSAIGRICRIVDPFEGTSNDGLRISTGEFRAHYAILSRDGVAGYSLYVGPDNIEIVAPSEEMLLLYSDDIWQLMAPYGEIQHTAAYEKLVATFGLVEL
jgi:hypothetical protein